MSDTAWIGNGVYRLPWVGPMNTTGVVWRRPLVSPVRPECPDCGRVCSSKRGVNMHQKRYCLKIERSRGNV